MDHEAIPRIYAYNPYMKIIVMLRDPVSRAYSSYNYSVNYGHHDAYGSFLDSIEAEMHIEKEDNIVSRNNLGHFYGSLYYKHLSKWVAQFPREQLLLLKTSDLRDTPQQLSGELFSFLNIANSHGAIEHENVAAVPANKKLEKFLLDRDNGLRRVIRAVTPRFLKNMIIESGVVDKLHDKNRKEQRTTPLSEEEIEKAKPYFNEDLQLLKSEYGIEI